MKKIGFYGYPPKELIKKFLDKKYDFIDLDIDYKVPDSGILPSITCQIIKNIMNNAIFYKKDIETIIATIGEAKCDSGRFIADLLKDMGFKVILCSNRNTIRGELKISNSDIPLIDKISMIMVSIIKEIKLPKFKKVKPEFGFWGVPPNDFSILELFPDETAVYGWTRCVEAGVPADLELENYIEKGVKTVFFTQSFCSKTILAKYLAEKHEGLFIDMEKMATHSIKAKIEAFIRLR